MQISPMGVQLKRVAYCLGILQGLTYAILAVMCIIMYNQNERRFYENSYMNVVEENIYYFFLGPEYVTAFIPRSFRPGVFAGIVWVHFFLHLGWCGLSLESLRRSSVISSKFIMSWSHYTLLLSLWDFITVVIIGSDYQKCMDFAGSNPSNQGMCATGILPVLVIAAKGFVLWIINVTFAIVMHKMGARLKREAQFEARPVQQPPSVPIGFPQQYPTSQPNTYPAQPRAYPAQPNVYPAQPNIYPVQPPRQPYAVQSPLDVSRNHFEYPVHIPDPDYQQRQQSPASPAKY